MKIKNAILVLSLLFFSTNNASASEKNIIITSIKPLYSIVSSIIADSDQAELLITSNQTPHDYQLRPSQIKAMQDASIIFYFDNNFETFMRSTFDILPLKVRKASIIENVNLDILEYREGGSWEEHKDNHTDVDEDDHDDVHEEDHADDHYDTHGDKLLKNKNLHVWLDPENTKKIVDFIVKELSFVYPKNHEIYEENGKKYIKKLNKLDDELNASLIGLQNKPFIVFHDAYQYFEKTYSLKAVGSITFRDDIQSVSPKRIKEIKNKINLTGAKCIFREPQYSDRLINTIAEMTDVKIGTLDPLGSNIQNDKELYFTLMRELADNFKKCLAY